MHALTAMQGLEQILMPASKILNNQDPQKKNGFLMPRRRSTAYEGKSAISSYSTAYEIKSLEEIADSSIVFQRLAKLDWSFSNANTTYLSHDIHPYPAKFPPQIPAHLIRNLSLQSELIWDPFGGSGTTALEALLAERRCISTDINPLSEIIGRAKTTILVPKHENELTRLAGSLQRHELQTPLFGDTESKTNGWEQEIPRIPNIEKWFHKNAILELAKIKSLIKNLKYDESKTIAKVALSRTILRVSNQDSETRYSWSPKELGAGETSNLFSFNLIEILKKIKTTSSFLKNRMAQFGTLDATKAIVAKWGAEGSILENSIDLIVTSPPYPNVTDYHLYNRFRLFWLGYDPKQFANAEIGSHLRHQKEMTGFSAYTDEMKLCVTNFYLALKPGRYAAIVVGDAIFGGQVFSTSTAISKIAENCGFQVVGVIERPIHKTRRSFMPKARRAEVEEIIILRKPATETTVFLEHPTYRLWPYEQKLEQREINQLIGEDPKRTRFRWKARANAMQIDRLRRLTFVRSFYSSQLSQELTWQARLENGGLTHSSRKESKYVTHGIHPYKGKFYPQLAKVIQNIGNPRIGARILDPFCGSGTVLLEAYLNGFEAFGCDLNPLAVEIARIKVEILTVDIKMLTDITAKLCSNLDDGCQDCTSLGRFQGQRVDEIERWFPEQVIRKLELLLDRIDRVRDEIIRRFLSVVLSSIIRQVSQQEPNDLRMRRRKEPIRDSPVFGLFRKALEEQMRKIMTFHRVSQYAPSRFIDAKVWNGDARMYSDFLKNCLSESSIDMVVTSPPYATALPYIDTDRLSMLVLFGLLAGERSEIEEALTGSREISKRSRRRLEDFITDNDYGIIVSELAKNTIKTIYARNARADVGFRRMNLAPLLWRYYNDMTQVFLNLNKLVRNNGSIFVVIGDNYTMAGGKKTPIPTTQILKETGQEIGWIFEEAMPITVTTENLKHIRNAITKNTVLHFIKCD